MFKKHCLISGLHKGWTKWYEIAVVTYYDINTQEEKALLIRRYDAVGSAGRIMVQTGSLNHILAEYNKLRKQKADYSLKERRSSSFFSMTPNGADISAENILFHYQEEGVDDKYVKVLFDAIEKIEGRAISEAKVAEDDAQTPYKPTPRVMPEGWGAWG